MRARSKASERPMKQYKTFVTSGRYKERLSQLRAKKQKLAILEALIKMHEERAKPDFTYIRHLKRKANDVRAQKNVLSTVDPNDNAL